MKTKILLSTAAMALGLSVAVVSSASSATVYDIAYSANNGDTGNFDITLGAAVGGGFFSVVGITGIWDGQAITGLLAPLGYAGNDDLFSPTPTPDYFTFPGISFSTTQGIDINIANNGTAVYTEDRSDSDPGGTPQFPITMSVTAVPEPGIWALMIAGLFGMGAMLRLGRRNRAGALVTG